MLGDDNVCDLRIDQLQYSLRYSPSFPLERKTGAMTEKPQLSSIQQRIAALKQLQAGGGALQSPPFLHPPTKRSSSALSRLSYNVNGSALDGAWIQRAPRLTQTPSPQPEGRAKKTPPPLPTRRTDRPPPLLARPEFPSRPRLPELPEQLQSPSHPKFALLYRLADLRIHRENGRKSLLCLTTHTQRP